MILAFGWNSDSQVLRFIEKKREKAATVAKGNDLALAQSILKEILSTSPSVYFSKSNRLDLLDQSRLDLAQIQFRQGQLPAARKNLDQIQSPAQRSKAQ